jgi:hypothetical protein
MEFLDPSICEDFQELLQLLELQNLYTHLHKTVSHSR